MVVNISVIKIQTSRKTMHRLIKNCNTVLVAVLDFTFHGLLIVTFHIVPLQLTSRLDWVVPD